MANQEDIGSFQSYAEKTLEMGLIAPGKDIP